MKRLDGIYLKIRTVVLEPENKRRLTLGSAILISSGVFAFLIFTLFPFFARATITPLWLENNWGEKILFSQNIEPTFILDTDGLIKSKQEKTAQGELVIEDSKIKTELLYGEENSHILAEIKTLPDKGDQFEIKVPSKNQFKPGQYQLKVTLDTPKTDRTISQDFSWGVLAVNTNKSIYLPGEKAHLALAVLNEEGKMVCDADIHLEIKDPKSEIKELSTSDGAIKINPECFKHRAAEKPDYEAEYRVSVPGQYQIKVTAITQNGSWTIFDYFEVRESVSFDVERQGPTRIYPPADYEMKLKIKADQDFAGQVVEQVPDVFEIQAQNAKIMPDSGQKSKKIIWQADWQADQTYEFSYQFKAPEISPQFYLLGPLEMGEFQEIRQWQLAVDDPDTANLIVTDCDFNDVNNPTCYAAISADGGTNQELSKGNHIDAPFQTLGGVQSVNSATLYYDTWGTLSGTYEVAVTATRDGTVICNDAAAPENGSETRNNLTCDSITPTQLNNGVWFYIKNNDDRGPESIYIDYVYLYVDYTPTSPNITVDTTGTQVSTMDIPSTENYVGGAFTFVRNTGSTNVTQIVISETGNVNANANLSNVDIRYEEAGTCSYQGTETLFGTAASFDGSENATVSGTMPIDTDQTCVYVILDVGAGAGNGEELEIEITDSSTEVTVDAGTVTPNTPEAISGTTTLQTANQNPNDPTSLAQKKTDDTTLNTGDWTDETSVKYTATVTDPDSDQVRLCIEKDPIGTGFSGTEDLCGGLVDSGQTATVTITSQTDDTQYHWQARTKDANDAYSNWVSYGGNGEGERDYGIDTSAPTGGAVSDGTSGDQDWNDGALDSISANWSGFDASVSGLQKYEYAVRRASDDYYWNASGSTWQSGESWVDSGVSTSVTVNPIYLQTGENYYFSVKAIDNAQNTASPVNSNGQQVSPTLSFSYDTNTIAFDDLNNANNWTDTKTNTFTTSTNAYLGYTIQGYITQLLTSLAYPSQTIDNFYGTWANPELWPLGTYGFGYTSDDTLVQGSNRFNNGTEYAGFSQTASGDVVADHTDSVTGLTGAVSSEQFIITYKVAVSSSQAASEYQTFAIYIITANY